MERLVPLGDARSRDPEIAGYKAAELGRALVAEMPALPGWVLPLGESAAALALGEAAGDGGSPASSILAVSSAPLDDELRGALQQAVVSLGGSVVVRSSSPLEADPRWSGAFATYLDVGADDIEAAVRGCWASVFTRDAAARGDRLDVDPASGGVAVLIQPWVGFAGGGVAVVRPDGSIHVSATRGAPADLVSGRDAGVSFDVDAGGSILEGRLPEGIDPRMAGSAVDLARTVATTLGDDTIEWGWVSGAVTLLQAGRGASSIVVEVRPMERRRRRYPPVASRLAMAAAAHPGALGERWILPWALAVEQLPPPTRVEIRDVRTAIAEAAGLAEELAASVWQLPRDRVEAEAGASFRAVLGPDPFDELSRLSALRPPPDPARTARLLGLISAIGGALWSTRSIPSPDHVWSLSPRELEGAARRRSGVVRTGHDRWEPFVFSVVEDRGHSSRGRSASPGIGAGQAYVVSGSSWRMPPPRRVLVVGSVVPQLASLLWGAAGLVARTGSEGAHLFEVARSLGVPAVIGVDLGAVGNGVIAVDGDGGTVSLLDAHRSERWLPDAELSVERRTG